MKAYWLERDKWFKFCNYSAIKFNGPQMIMINADNRETASL